MRQKFLKIFVSFKFFFLHFVEKMEFVFWKRQPKLTSILSGLLLSCPKIFCRKRQAYKSQGKLSHRLHPIPEGIAVRSTRKKPKREPLLQTVKEQ